ncbi:hypothetical protein O6H91_23G039300 [Diphasiastrum complanatum]|uniref:Uncharacterized protein n=6 Tax=Diphasiastrum complanatum TaxID=34168 RepID=A0ACC2A9X9_DIPCM|nr:hypothetical protein O6H91_23G039300 [Diphasiastrum complanatum]KAJ7514326.1 hypothetical protein O6H91_23G039300 [Diphasiastrum complanatum]KAJ7514327.1 hypothetical protein O6H91_23G039300 [Diphasiastrum complanatum]KAJ7514328.1 hypothetical protein O6H91_23G039300 [Diphasiastrum complanatum]KAJ7514329.1 hypothetical protein O6H91_23G039300 [Diphasiastrum complanatum]
MTGAIQETVCVTGAGGFIASWLVKFLLERGYRVIGTVRDPDEEKNAHLKRLEGANERLTLLKADLLDYESIVRAVKGVDGVFHTACPVTDNLDIVQGPAVQGTLNVLKACSESNVKRLVLTSSLGAIYMNPARPLDDVVIEKCWSDTDYLQQTKNGYCLAKTLAEHAAWDYAKKSGLDMVVINPAVVLGPLLQSTLNASTSHILKYLTGSAKTYANFCQAYVDVRDVAQAHILAYETPSASGRYVCADRVLHRGELVDLLAKLYPEYPIPRKCSDERNPRAQPFKISNEKIQNLGLKFLPFEQCLKDSVSSLQERGFINTL